MSHAAEQVFLFINSITGLSVCVCVLTRVTVGCLAQLAVFGRRTDPVLRVTVTVGCVAQLTRVTVGCLAQLAVFGRRTDPVLRSACSRRVTTMWVNRPLQVSQLGQLSLSSFRGRSMSSRPV